MKPTVALIVTLSAATLAMGQTPISGDKFPGADHRVRHVIGLDEKTKKNAMGSLTIHDGALEFKSGNPGQEVVSQVPVSSVEDVFIGTESTQTRGKSAKVVKTAGYAAPYGTGRSLSLLMRDKVDILTVSFHDRDGSLHGAIFALPLGQAEGVRTQLVQAGAHASPIEP
jgi:hypothetical protein